MIKCNLGALRKYIRMDRAMIPVGNMMGYVIEGSQFSSEARIISPQHVQAEFRVFINK
jgi:hypothetical protein